MKLSWIEKLKPVTKQSPRINSDEDYFFEAQAPHLALQAPHLAMLDLEPHLVLEQPAAKAPPERAAAVTTAEARVFAILEESWFMEKSLESETGNMCGKARKVK